MRHPLRHPEKYAPNVGRMPKDTEAQVNGWKADIADLENGEWPKVQPRQSAPGMTQPCHSHVHHHVHDPTLTPRCIYSPSRFDPYIYIYISIGIRTLHITTTYRKPTLTLTRTLTLGCTKEASRRGRGSKGRRSKCLCASRAPL